TCRCVPKEEVVCCVTRPPATASAHSRLLPLSGRIGRLGRVQTGSRTQPTGRETAQSVRAGQVWHLALSPRGSIRHKIWTHLPSLDGRPRELGHARQYTLRRRLLPTLGTICYLGSSKR